MSFLRWAGMNHEPRAARKLVSGEYWHSVAEPPHAVVAFAAGCTCGWQSDVEHWNPRSGASDAFAEWCEKHIRPLVRPLAEQVAGINPAAFSVAHDVGPSEEAQDGRWLVDVVALAAMHAEIERALEWRVKALREGGAHWEPLRRPSGCAKSLRERGSRHRRTQGPRRRRTPSTSTHRNRAIRAA